MLTKDVAKLAPVDRLVYWIKERETVRRLREAGKPKPWTEDEILQTYRFCNVRRMDDRVSRWLYDNWYKPYFGHPNMLVACAAARFFNLPSTLELMGFPYVWKGSRVKALLRKHRDKGNQIFNGAYIVTGSGGGSDKIETVVDVFLTPLAKMDASRIVDTTSLETTWENLVQCKGFGSFTAGQVVADLRWAVSGMWKDAKQWAPLGPGSKRGMNRILENPINTPMRQDVFQSLLEDLTRRLKKRLPRSLTNRLEAIDYQNCLCEFDKYERTLFEGRRPKSIFRSEA